MSLEDLKSYWIKAPIVLYVLGFIVHNTYLANFGNYDFELVQAKYITVGFGIVAFSALCFAYCSIRVNLSYVFESMRISNLLPWMLRVASLPLVIYSVLYFDSHEDVLSIRPDQSHLEPLLFSIGYFVVSFSIGDLVFRYTDGDKFSAKALHVLHMILSLPVIVGVLYLAYNNSEFGSIAKASTFFFFGLIGMGLAQKDREAGIEQKLLDEKSKDEHKTLFTIFFGVIAIGFMLWITISNYVESVYPKLPVALGGARIESIEIHFDERVVKSNLIQETGNWILYINPETGNVEKLRASEIKKIVYFNE